jgi:hypothetical protein
MLFFCACKKETTTSTLSKPIKGEIPECLVNHTLLDRPFILSKGINGRVCGTLNDTTMYKSYLKYIDYKDYFSITLTNYNSIDFITEVSGFRYVPKQVGTYNLKTYSDTKIKPSTSGFTWMYNDTTLDDFVLDTTKVNTIEILDSGESSNEIFGIFNVHYVEQQCYAIPSLANFCSRLDFKNCYFRAKIN